jgi:hypothetical protein
MHTLPLDRADSIHELKARENKYRNLFKGSKDAVFISDKNLVFTEYNHAVWLIGSEMESSCTAVFLNS